MAISAIQAGIWNSYISTGNVTVTGVTGAASSGDLMVIVYGTKPFGDAPTIDQSWTNGGSFTNGSTGSSIDGGSMQCRIFYKIHTGTESDPTITNSTNSVSMANYAIFRKASNKNWEVAVFGGGDATAGTGFSAASTAAVDLAVDDWFHCIVAVPTDAVTTLTGASLSASGITFAGFTNYPAIQTTASGQDMAAWAGYNIVTVGSGSVTVTLAATLGASSTGTYAGIRMREVDPPVGTNFDDYGMLGFYGM